MNLRRRAAGELLTLGVLSSCFLLLFPVRPATIDMGLALFALAVIVLNAKYTRTKIRGSVSLSVERQRWQGCMAETMVFTTLAAGVFLIVGIAIGYLEGGSEAVSARILKGKILLSIAFYLPWALLQQTLFQFYLLGRWRALWPSIHPLSHSTINGLVFGLVHLPDIGVTVLTALGGTAWSFLYLRYQLLLPLAVSHAVLGSTFYSWVYGQDLADAWSASITSLFDQEW